MSHYAVFVTNTDKVNLDEQLEPFDESKRVASYVSMTREELIEEAREIADRIKKKNEDGKKLDDWEEYFVGINTDEEFYKAIRKYYERYGSSYNEKGDLLSNYNPNSRWDWYSIGGKWHGKWETKDGRNGDVFRKADLNLEKMTDDLKRESGKYWDLQNEKYIKSVNAENEWFISMEGDRPTIVKPLLELWSEGEDISREDYINNIGAKAWVPRAILHNGEWHEDGRVGWWGFSLDEDPNLDWNKEFLKVWDELPPDTEITVVDYHI